ncbi:MAG: NADH-quinone oxidoreductase subunit H [Deltaproteobacteria bacterium]|jgi:NADH-quinone oxidoreductase subunit H|nr:NADH-quinone oxidoreductase subunit H [Deltaproteobacteria bacterium]
MPIEPIIKILFIFSVMVMGLAPIITWIERKQSAVMQDRIGANRADLNGITILGLLHPAADVIKLMMKEDMVPEGANRVMHMLSPLIAAVPAIMAFAVIPFGGVYVFGDTTLNLVGADIDWGLLYIFVLGSIAAYGNVVAGWSSNNNWSMLGGLRASAQMISYEVTMGLTIVGIFMVFQTLRLSDMALAQDTSFRVLGFLDVHFGLNWAWIDWIRLPAWGIIYQPLGFLMFLTAVMAENKRPPFDLPEGESEIIAGYHLEYSGMRFGLFFMSEFIEIILIAALTTTLFLGGWAVPWLSTETIINGISSVMGTGFATGLCILIHFVSFLLKVIFMIWVQMLIRWSLPRFRYDQVMSLCWKILLPLSIANIFVTGAVLLWVKG